ncbi:MAG TPA: hypothetical protein VM033_05550 [Gemmatimonadaceae bacterium]|nr:hypothetical protein [Gemmatimonadaceae bacterium]
MDYDAFASPMGCPALRKDFGGSEAAVGRFIARWFPAGAERTLLLSGHFAVEKTSYDWKLNSQGNARRMAQPR